MTCDSDCVAFTKVCGTWRCCSLLAILARRAALLGMLITYAWASSGDDSHWLRPGPCPVSAVWGLDTCRVKTVPSVHRVLQLSASTDCNCIPVIVPQSFGCRSTRRAEDNAHHHKPGTVPYVNESRRHPISDPATSEGQPCKR